MDLSIAFYRVLYLLKIDRVVLMLYAMSKTYAPTDTGTSESRYRDFDNTL